MSDTVRPLSTIAAEISRVWSKPNPAAAPYLTAMRQLNTLDDMYGAEDAHGIVLRFLYNASSWRGEDARRVKAELKGLLAAREAAKAAATAHHHQYWWKDA